MTAPKSKAGRPGPGEPVKPYLVTLTAKCVERARALGGGNLSKGIRNAVRIAFGKGPLY